MERLLRAQPPSSGCELKLQGARVAQAGAQQPPSSGCELKLAYRARCGSCSAQPPSSGCELKLEQTGYGNHPEVAAAFERL